METKKFCGIEFKVYTDTKIEGDFIYPYEAVYFENDIEITGRLEVKYLKCKKSINVHKLYIVDKWEEVGGSQKVGLYQKVGLSQEIGGSQVVGGSQKVGGSQEVGRSQVVGLYQGVGEYQKVGGSQEIGWSQVVGGSQKVGEFQEVGRSQVVGEFQKVGEYQKVGWYQVVGWYQGIGWYQEVGWDLTVHSSKVSLYSKVGGKYKAEGKVFIGVCEWKETTKEEETLTCGEFISGDIKYGYLEEVGLLEEGINDDKTEEAMKLLRERGYKIIKE
jgi:hypothetical protein